MSANAIEIVEACKSFERGKPVLKDVNLSIAPGEMVALIGASGSGKSTLIRAIAGLVPIDRKSGANGDATVDCRIEVFGVPMQRHGRIAGEAKAAARARRRRLSAIQSRAAAVGHDQRAAWDCSGRSASPAALRPFLASGDKQRAMNALDRVGIAEQALKRGSELSGGQQQRAAIARTLDPRRRRPHRGRADRVARSELGAPHHGHPGRPQREGRHHRAGLAASGRIRAEVLPAHHRACAAGEVVYDGPSEALTPTFLGELYGAESEELFLPGSRRHGRGSRSREGAAKSPGRRGADARQSKSDGAATPGSRRVRRGRRARHGAPVHAPPVTGGVKSTNQNTGGSS